MSFDADAANTGDDISHPLHIDIIQGNLIHLDAPAIVLALFKRVTPTAATKEFDLVLNGRLDDLFKLGGFGREVGDVTFQPVFDDNLKAQQLVFAGLGEFDELRPETIRIAAENVARRFILSGIDTITTVAIGLGVGQTAGKVVPALLGGLLEEIKDSDLKGVIKKINICDFNENNCNSLFDECLKYKAQADTYGIDISIGRNSVDTTKANGHHPVYPTHLFVELTPDKEKPDEELCLEIKMMGSGGNAATYTFEHRFNRQNLMEKIDEIISREVLDHNYGLEMLKYFVGEKVAHALEQELDSGEKPLRIIHDEAASVIPWEVISYINRAMPATTIPVCRSFIIPPHRYQKWSPRQMHNDVLNLLLIVNPTADLRGAEAEGDLVYEALKDNPLIRIKKLWQKEATRDAILKELDSGKYDAVHYAGHAKYKENAPKKTGLYCADRTFLTGEDVQKKLSNFPPLMFLNACQSAMMSESGTNTLPSMPSKKAEAEAGLAEAFIFNGVQQFIGTYWPVGDKAALAFAKRLYEELLTGQTIGDAIYYARQEVLKVNKKDWATYVHFGDPVFKLKLKGKI